MGLPCRCWLFRARARTLQSILPRELYFPAPSSWNVHSLDPISFPAQLSYLFPTTDGSHRLTLLVCPCAIIHDWAEKYPVIILMSGEIYGLSSPLSFQSRQTFSASPSSAPVPGSHRHTFRSFHPSSFMLPASLPHSSVPANEPASNFREKNRGHHVFLSEFLPYSLPASNFSGLLCPHFFLLQTRWVVMPLSATGHVQGLRGEALRLLSRRLNLRYPKKEFGGNEIGEAQKKIYPRNSQAPLYILFKCHVFHKAHPGQAKLPLNS